VANGVVYMGSDDDFLYALDALDGSELWRFEQGEVSSDPATAGGSVYVGGFDETEFTDFVLSLDALTGDEHWRFEAGDADSSPAVVDSTVFVGGGDEAAIYALDALTGELSWRIGTEGTVNTSPAVVEGMVFAADGEGYVYAIGSNARSADIPQIDDPGQSRSAQADASSPWEPFDGWCLDFRYPSGWVVDTHDRVGTSESVVMYNFQSPNPVSYEGLEPGQIKVEFHAIFPKGNPASINDEVLEERSILVDDRSQLLTISQHPLGYVGLLEMYKGEIQFILSIGATSLDDVVRTIPILGTLDACTFELAS
jgi:hypothetical protein